MKAQKKNIVKNVSRRSLSSSQSAKQTSSLKRKETIGTPVNSPAKSSTRQRMKSNSKTTQLPKAPASKSKSPAKIIKQTNSPKRSTSQQKSKSKAKNQSKSPKKPAKKYLKKESSKSATRSASKSVKKDAKNSTTKVKYTYPKREKREILKDSEGICITKPLKPLNGYFKFCAEKQVDLKKSNPNLKQIEIMSALSVQYKKLSNSERLIYEQEYAEDKKQYEKLYSAYKQKYGHLEENKVHYKKNKKAKESSKSQDKKAAKPGKQSNIKQQRGRKSTASIQKSPQKQLQVDKEQVPFILGTWQGKGKVLGTNLKYTETFVLTLIKSEPNWVINWQQFTKNAESDKPLHAENGFLKIFAEKNQKGNKAELLLSHPFSVNEICQSHFNFETNTLVCEALTEDSFQRGDNARGQRTIGTRREYQLNQNGSLSYNVSLQVEGGELKEHLKGKLKKQK